MTPTWAAQATLAHSGTASVAAGYGTDWLYLLIPLGIIVAITAYLVVTGARGERRVIGFVPRAAASLERITGLPAWSAGGVLMGTGALIIAVIGFLWDVAWHIDFGRDEFLFTPAHSMIVIGLLLLIAAAVTSVVLATVNRVVVGIQFKNLRIPFSAIALATLGTGAVIGFPLDELWHSAYGVDVTMWGPTHLLMIGGASLSPIALWLMLTEAGPEANRSGFALVRRTLLAGAVLIGLSTFQGEFDFGVPQFQQLYHPVLIVAAASVGLVAARAALGRWGAVKATAFFLVARASLALLVGEALNHTIPRFPLYLGAALVVEGVWHLARELRAIPRAVISGVVVGTVGLATEWAWTLLWGWHPWNATLWPGIIVASLIGIPGAIIGLAMGRVFAFRAAVTTPRLLMACGAAMVLLLAIPFPRNDIDATADIATERVGRNLAMVHVEVDPPLGDTDWAEVLAWQGGHMDAIPLEATGPRTYESAAPVPVGGDWKTLVRFADRDVMVAAPVYLPEDPAIGAHEVPVVAQRRTELVRDTDLLLREAKEGPSWPALVAYLGIAAVACGWLTTLCLAFTRVNPGARLGLSQATGSNVKKRRAPSVAMRRRTS
ncbi:MAG: hypothetical protein KY391_01145 [Actinobacteria bacterium]|nr:hypothetical protein [Actinomycetota bacterium]